MNLTSIIPESTIDYPGKYGPLVFSRGCNYNCPTCQNPELIKSKKINNEEINSWIENLKYKVKQGWYQGITISGGEPTNQLGLKNFARELKDIGLLIKLDTNGSNYGVLKELLEDKLVDYVAMDVKGPPHLYAKLIGKDFIDLRDNVEKGIGVTSNFPDYEFRTTVVPVIRDDGKIEFLTPEEIGETARFIYEYTGTKEHKYFLQKFVSRKKGEIMDERFSKENLPKEMWETPMKHLEKCLVEAQKYLPNANIR